MAEALRYYAGWLYLLIQRILPDARGYQHFIIGNGEDKIPCRTRGDRNTLDDGVGRILGLGFYKSPLKAIEVPEPVTFKSHFFFPFIEDILQ